MIRKIVARVLFWGAWWMIWLAAWLATADWWGLEPPALWIHAVGVGAALGLFVMGLVGMLLAGARMLDAERRKGGSQDAKI